MPAPWNEVRLGLMALGYRRIVYVEISCHLHGDFRGALDEEADGYTCPVCAGPCELVHAIEGFTRREVLPDFVRVAPPLSAWAREWLMSNEDRETISLRAKQRKLQKRNDRYMNQKYRRAQAAY